MGYAVLLHGSCVSKNSFLVQKYGGLGVIAELLFSFPGHHNDVGPYNCLHVRGMDKSQPQRPPFQWVLQSMLPDIIILVADFWWDSLCTGASWRNRKQRHLHELVR